jgi:hypothetical protein
MSEAYQQYLLWVAWLSYGMVLVVRIRSRSRHGPTPFLAFAFATFGTLALSVRANGPMWLTIVLALLLALCLFLDFGVRSARRTSEE